MPIGRAVRRATNKGFRKAPGGYHAASMQEQQKVAVLGAGAYGTALAKVLAGKGNPVTLYCRRPELVTQINEEHVNGKYLPTAKLPALLRATPDLEECLHHASMVVFVAPSHATRDVA